MNRNAGTSPADANHGFDATDAEHMAGAATVEIAYRVLDAQGHVIHQTDLIANGDALAKLIRSGL